MGLAAIPESLWRQNQLHIPAALAEALRAELTARDRFDEACGPNPSERELYGGKGHAESLGHFVHRFKTSAARVQFVALNPSGTFDPHAADLRGCLLDGNVALLDVACGSGGGLLGLLATLAELRGRGHSGLLPLDLSILAADCSEEARAIHAGMCARLRLHLEAIGIRARAEYQDWDATNPLSTTKLMDRWLGSCPGSEVYLVFVSAFSAFMAENPDAVLEAVAGHRQAPPRQALSRRLDLADYQGQREGATESPGAPRQAVQLVGQGEGGRAERGVRLPPPVHW